MPSSSPAKRPTRRVRPRVMHVEFNFGQHSVFFEGDQLKIYGDEGLDASAKNPWESNRNEDRRCVTGRKYKPRITDALEVLNQFLANGELFFPKASGEQS